MKTIAVFRPGCAFRRTVFENQLICYDYLQKHHGYSIKIIVDKTFEETDSRFEWIRIPVSAYRQSRFLPATLFAKYRKHVLKQYLSGSDIVIAPDPVVYSQSHLAVEIASENNSSIWIDSTITLLSERPFNRFNRITRNRCLRSFEICDAILAPSPKVIERYSHIGLLTKSLAEKFFIIGHAVDTDRFSPLPDKYAQTRDILCVSRLVPEKGIAYILEGFLNLSESFPDSRLIFIGEGPMENYIRKASGNLFGDRVIIKPNLSHELLHREFQSACGYISHPIATPKWEEYFGVANIEAMSCGIPVIISKSGALLWSARPPAVVMWTEERNIDQICESMKRVLTLSPEERLSIAGINRRYAIANYSLGAVTGSLTSLLSH